MNRVRDEWAANSGEHGEFVLRGQILFYELGMLNQLNGIFDRILNNAQAIVAFVIGERTGGDMLGSEFVGKSMGGHFRCFQVQQLLGVITGKAVTLMLTILILAIFAAAVIYVVRLILQEVKENKKPDHPYPFDFPALIAFANKADDAYILTHATLDIMPFSKFATGKVCNELIEFLYRNPPKMFGSKKHRKRTWTVMAYNDSLITLKKEITHRQVKVKRGMRIKLGDEMVEYWDIAVTAKEPLGYKVQAVNADSHLENEVY